MHGPKEQNCTYGEPAAAVAHPSMYVGFLRDWVRNHAVSVEVVCTSSKLSAMGWMSVHRLPHARKLVLSQVVDSMLAEHSHYRTLHRCP